MGEKGRVRGCQEQREREGGRVPESRGAMRRGDQQAGREGTVSWVVREGPGANFILTVSCVPTWGLCPVSVSSLTKYLICRVLVKIKSQ